MKWLLSLLALSAVGQNFTQDAFAVECVGTSKSRSTLSGRLVENSDDLGKQVYVVDPVKEAVYRALFPRQEFDPVCAGKGQIPFGSVSPGLILAKSEDPYGSDPFSTCDFELDRMTGKGTQSLNMEWSDGRYIKLEWTFDCEKTEVPIFDPTKRKF